MDDLSLSPALTNLPDSFASSRTPLDAGLDAMRRAHPIMENGYFDHGTMALEALDAMGMRSQIASFTAQHLAHAGVRRAPEAAQPIQANQWQSALGQGERFADWVELLEAELVASSWKSLAQKWVVRLTPGATTAALHGLIRTAHAVRALSRRNTAARRAELVRAIASWASLYGVPPWPAMTGQGKLSPRATFQHLTPAPQDQRAPQGSISGGLTHALNAPGFADELAQADFTRPLEDSLNTLVITLADAFLAHARSPYTAVVWCHAITATMAVRRLRPVLNDDEARALLMRVFEAAAAMKAAFFGLHGDQDPGSDVADARYTLAKLAAQTGDDHAIKLTDALLEAHSALGDERLLLAANRGIRLLGR